MFGKKSADSDQPKGIGKIQKTEEQYITFYKAKLYKEALIECNLAIQLDRNNAQAHYVKSMILADLERYEEALVAFEQAIQLNPRAAYMYASKGMALYKLGRFEEVILACGEAIRLIWGGKRHARRDRAYA